MADESDLAGDLTQRVARWAVAGERYEVEFKSELRWPLNDRDLVEAAVCLANGHGGMLLIGIEDDGTVTGARPRHEAGRTDPFRVQALVANMTQPPISVVVSLVELAGQDVLVVEVPDSPRVVGTTQGTYVRSCEEGNSMIYMITKLIRKLARRKAS
jgi:ATP-dependent DNA helicase RecG